MDCLYALLTPPIEISWYPLCVLLSITPFLQDETCTQENDFNKKYRAGTDSVDVLGCVDRLGLP